MRTWEIEVQTTYTQLLRIEADTWSDAHNMSLSTKAAPDSSEVSSTGGVLRQLGEPWVDGKWYDLHGPGDIVLCGRAYGNAFTQADVDLLAARLTVLGLVVVDSWNGAGTNTVSFRCTGRIGEDPFTNEQQRELCAPREPKP